MLDYRQNEIVIVENLKSYLTTDDRPCEVVRQNQVAKIPPYPYVSYSVITPVDSMGGTYSQDVDGTFYRTIQQVWSFTVQSDDQEEAMALAYRAFDFFTIVGVVPLSDNGIVVRRVGGITARDNLITIQYEYRNGLDVTFGLLYSITPEDQIFNDVIETCKFEEV